MGFLDELAGKATGGVPGGSGEPGSGLAAGIMDMLNKQPGGLPGLLQTFHDKGLGGVASSWVSTGENLPISTEQLQGVLGNDTMRELAAKAGLSPGEASSQLAKVLPQMVDKLTPEGKVPEGGDLMQQALGFLNQRS